MKPTTKIWYQCESIGKPEHNITGHEEVRTAALTIGRWLFESYMGNYMRITIARTEAELTQKLSVGNRPTKSDDLAMLEEEFLRLADELQPD